jgi:quercetin dioxygenase-like cupin family protein
MRRPAASRIPIAVLAFVGLGAFGAQAQAQVQAVKDVPVAYAVNDSRLKWGPCPDFLPKGCEVAVLHGDPAKPNVDIFFKVPGKAKLASHKHTSAERMVLVQGELQVTYDGHKPITLKRGTYAFGPAEHVHEATCVSAEPCVLFIAFEQPLDAIPSPMTVATPAPMSSGAASKPAAATAEKKPKKGGC